MARSKPWKVIENIDTYKVWQVDRIEDCDWPILLFVKVTYTDEYDREWAEKGKYHVQIEAVAPDAPEAEAVMGCINSIGSNLPDWNKMDEVWRARALADYGTYAMLWQDQGDNLRKLLKGARNELVSIPMLIGFRLDRAMNAIGNSGWDFLKGEIGLKRTGSPAAE